MIKQQGKRKKWSYPVIYVSFIIISFLPLYTDKPYPPQDIQKVLIDLFTVATIPYKNVAPIFHIVTLILVILISLQRIKLGRLLALYMGINYLLLIMFQAIGKTIQYGLVIHIGGMILYAILGITWIIVAIRNELLTTFNPSAWRHLILIPFALLAFWAPYSISNNIIMANFNLILLLSSDYGLTLCFTVPVFLFLMILFYPNVNEFAYRITAFNGLVYGLLNITHWFNSSLRWMGVLHLPLLVISIYALLLPVGNKQKSGLTSRWS